MKFIKVIKPELNYDNQRPKIKTYHRDACKKSVRLLARVWRAICLCLAMGFVTASISYAAQDAAPITDITAADAITQTQPHQVNDALKNSPAVQEKFKTYSRAERDLLESVKAVLGGADGVSALDNSAIGETGQVLDADSAQSAETTAKANTIISGAKATEPKKKKSLIPTSPAEIKARAVDAATKVKGWLTSLAFLAQIAAIALAVFIAPIIASLIRKNAPVFIDPPGPNAKYLVVRQYLYKGRVFIRAIVLVGLLALFALVLRSTPSLGQDWLVKLAQGLAVVFLLYKVITTFISNPLVKRLAIWIVIPVALLAVFGYYDDLVNFLEGTAFMQMGGTDITLMTLIRLAIFGALFFWLGKISNVKGQTAIRATDSLDMATREVMAKLFQIVLFMVVTMLVLGAAGIPLSGLVMVFSAIGLGIGLGLQPVAANFVSGLIILFDRSVRKGDFIVLPDGQEGHVEAVNMRNTIVETTDGKDVMVPNTVFTESVYENWTHKDPRQRYEVYFCVAYDTDIDRLEDILIPAICNYDKVLMEPEEPDLELREFGEYGIHFAIEFWVSGIDDGENKFTSDLNYVVWRTLKKHGITMPLPQREVRMLAERKSGAKALSSARKGELA